MTVRAWFDSHPGITRAEAVRECAKACGVKEKSVLRKWKELYGICAETNGRGTVARRGA